MRTISQTLHEMIQENQMLQFAFAQRLFNLSQLARFLQPLLEARTKKEIQITALLMNLSRLQKQIRKIIPASNTFRVEKISINSDLCTMTFEKTKDIHLKVQRLSAKLLEQGEYANLTEGEHEITLIFENALIPVAQKMIAGKPKFENHDLVAVGIKFSPDYADIPGFIYSILQTTTLQGINTVELSSSTYTELILYVERKDAQLAFETIFHSFSGN